MVSHALACYPRECCGILIGRSDGDEREVLEAVACRNVYEGDQWDRFVLSPEEHLATQRRARECGLEVIGFFHSHPAGEAYFSATDLANCWPWCSNVVLAVRQGGVLGAKAFRANESFTHAEQEDLVLPEA